METLALLFICCAIVCAVGCMRGKHICGIAGDTKENDSIHEELVDIKKSVSEMQEYVADLYIQQNSQK